MTEGIESYEARYAAVSSSPILGPLLGEILRAVDIMALTGGAGGKFRIDVDYAPQAIADLEKAKLRLADAKDAAQRAGQATAPGRDRVSGNAVEQINRMAVGPEGSLLAALKAFEQAIDESIAGLKADLAAYRGVEEANIPKVAAAAASWD